MFKKVLCHLALSERKVGYISMPPAYGPYFVCFDRVT